MNNNNDDSKYYLDELTPIKSVVMSNAEAKRISFVTAIVMDVFFFLCYASLSLSEAKTFFERKRKGNE